MAELSSEGPITLQKIREETELDSELSLLKTTIFNGFPGSQHDTDPEIRSYFNVRDNLWVNEDVVMYGNRIVIPKLFRHGLLQFLHSAHQGTDGMRARAAKCIYWPGMNSAINEVRKNCKACSTISPSQPRQPLQPIPYSQYPFQDICIDECEIQGHHYLVVVDRFTNWLLIFHYKNHVQGKQVIESLKTLFETYGVPERIYSDGGLCLVSSNVTEFLDRWGVQHITSSAEYPQANGRAELGVKTAKRLLQNNIGPNGSVKTEAVCRALLQYRNTPIKNVGLSPAQMLFHRQLRDVLPVRSSLLRPHQQWITAANNREKALQKRDSQMKGRYNIFTKSLKPLPVGSRIRIQDSKFKKRWNRSGRIVEWKNQKYTIRVDGSNRVITRNRRFIRLDTTQPESDQQIHPYPLHHASDNTTATAEHSIHNTDEEQTTIQQQDQGSPLRQQSSLPEETLLQQTPVQHQSPLPQQRAVQQQTPLPQQRAVQQQSPLPRMLKELLPHNNAGLKET